MRLPHPAALQCAGEFRLDDNVQAQAQRIRRDPPGEQPPRDLRVRGVGLLLHLGGDVVVGVFVDGVELRHRRRVRAEDRRPREDATRGGTDVVGYRDQGTGDGGLGEAVGGGVVVKRCAAGRLSHGDERTGLRGGEGARTLVVALCIVDVDSSMAIVPGQGVSASEGVKTCKTR